MAGEVLSDGQACARRPVLTSLPSVTVVIPAYNHARYLGEAIESVLGQTRPADEVIVIDDGSIDDPAAIVRHYSGVKLVRQPNQGPSAARNLGIKLATSDTIVFLDADDRLLPDALRAGLNCLAASPGAAFVYGGYHGISSDGRQVGLDRFEPIGGDAFRHLLLKNCVGMVGCAIHSRSRLLEVGGFDTTARRCEDYDLFLRLALRYPVASHPNIVGEYRWHTTNVSTDGRSMLRGALEVHSRQRLAALQRKEWVEAWRSGRKYWRRFYGDQMLVAARASLRRKQLGKAIINTANALTAAPLGALMRLAGLATSPFRAAFGTVFPPVLR